MAGVLEVDLPGLDDLALGASAPCRITNACTVFAESEVVSLLSEGAARGSVAAGVFESIADQVAGLAERCTWRPPALFDGGPSRSRALALALGRRLGSEVFVPPGGQFATALGAALAAGSGREPDQLTASGQPVS
jgi:activator of 2-hydroxyglutaryl-CoA dehydratase